MVPLEKFLLYVSICKPEGRVKRKDDVHREGVPVETIGVDSWSSLRYGMVVVLRKALHVDGCRLNQYYCR
jgi:hypothetical protein